MGTLRKMRRLLENSPEFMAKVERRKARKSGSQPSIAGQTPAPPAAGAPAAAQRRRFPKTILTDDSKTQRKALLGE